MTSGRDVNHPKGRGLTTQHSDRFIYRGFSRQILPAVKKLQGDSLVALLSSTAYLAGACICLNKLPKYMNILHLLVISFLFAILVSIL
jgi:hypothetical protein